jgi:hypothetical protein
MNWIYVHGENNSKFVENRHVAKVGEHLPQTMSDGSICAATPISPGRRRRSPPSWGPQGAVEIIFRSDLGDAAKIEARSEEYRAKFDDEGATGDWSVHAFSPL